jgi:hypothetical protein
MMMMMIPDDGCWTTSHPMTADVPSSSAITSRNDHQFGKRYFRCQPDWDIDSDVWVTEDSVSLLDASPCVADLTAARHQSYTRTPSCLLTALAARIPLPDSPTEDADGDDYTKVYPQACMAPRPPPSQPCTPQTESSTDRDVKETDEQQQQQQQQQHSATVMDCTESHDEDVGCQDGDLDSGEAALRTPKDPVQDVVPSQIDLRSVCPSIYDDLNLSCSHISAACCLYEHAVHVALGLCDATLSNVTKRAAPLFREPPSRLFWYHAQREACGTGACDSGGSIRDALHVLRTTGVCTEQEHPFQMSGWTCTPSLDAYEQAWKTPPVVWARVAPTLHVLRHTLAAGFPIAFAMPVSWAFRTARVAETGLIPTVFSAKLRTDLGGGHALVLVGYNDEHHHFIVRNSWGKEWGREGHGFLSYKAVQNGMVASAWVLQVPSLSQ